MDHISIIHIKSAAVFIDIACFRDLFYYLYEVIMIQENCTLSKSSDNSDTIYDSIESLDSDSNSHEDDESSFDDNFDDFSSDFDDFSGEFDDFDDEFPDEDDFDEEDINGPSSGDDENDFTDDFFEDEYDDLDPDDTMNYEDFDE